MVIIVTMLLPYQTRIRIIIVDFYVHRTHYRLMVEANDNGSPSLSSLCSVEVSVTDVNEYRPIFTTILYIATVLDDSPVDSPVFVARATDRDAGLYGMVHYRLFRLGDDPGSPDLHINPVTGQVRTRSSMTSPRNGKAAFGYLVVAEDAGGLNATVNAVVTVELSSLKRRLRFENSSYHYNLPGNMLAGFVIGRVSVVRNDDLDGSDGHLLANGGVRYYFLQDSFVFGINCTSGEIYLQMDLRLFSLSDHVTHDGDGRDVVEGFVSNSMMKKDKRHLLGGQRTGLPQTSSFFNKLDARGEMEMHPQSAPMVTRNTWKRSASFSQQFEIVYLTIVAEWDFPERGKTMADLKIDIDRACQGCSVEDIGRRKDNFLSRSHLVTLLAFFLGILFVIVTVVVVTVLRRQRRCKPEKTAVAAETDHSTFRCSSINTTVGVPSPPPCPNSRGRRFRLAGPNCSAVRLSKTNEEVQLINNGFTPHAAHHVINSTHGNIDDDGGFRDRKRGIISERNDLKNAAPPLNVRGPLIEIETLRLLENSKGLFLDGELVLSPSSMESIHLFSEEGGGESDWLGTSLVCQERNQFPSGNSTNNCRTGDYFATKWMFNETNNNSKQQIVDTCNYPSSLALVQLVDCFPDYHSLSDVYKEIAKLRDDRQPSGRKLKPTKIVATPGEDPGTEKLPRFYPPPLLTDAPPTLWSRAKESRMVNFVSEKLNGFGTEM